MMKKIISVLMFLAVSAGMLCGCGGETMEVPEYPLDAAVIEEQLKAQKLEWTVEEEAAAEEHETVYTLYDAEGKKIAVVDSKGDEDGRYLQFTFMSSLREEEKDCAVITSSDWVSIIACGTVLFGGFEDQYQPYKEFTKVGRKTGKVKIFDRADMAEESDKIYEEIMKWTSKYDDTVCVFKLGQPEQMEPGLDRPDQELVSITFYNNDKYIEATEE